VIFNVYMTTVQDGLAGMMGNEKRLEYRQRRFEIVKTIAGVV